MTLEGYNFFRPLCSPDTLKYHKPGVASKGGGGQLVWSEEQQKWIDCGSQSVLGTVRTVSDNDPEDYTGQSEWNQGAQ